MSNKKTNGFEEQIGNLGGEESLTGKKIPVPGQRKDLSETEEAEMNAFLNRSNAAAHGGTRTAILSETAASVAEGWIAIDRDELGIRSRFYPKDWQFFVRPATVEAIKNWSSIDEERIDVVNTVFNDIIRTCVKITSAAGNIPWNKINSWDRFWFILKVREYTFKEGEAKIEFKDTCPECETELTYNLTSKSLHYEFPDDDIVDRYWDANERVWYINPRDYDLDADIVKLYVPTLEKDQALLDWAISKTRAKSKIDSVFLKFLPWLLPKAPKDEQVFEKFVKDCELIFKSWDTEMFDFMDEVIFNITVNTSEKLRQVCPHCGEEVLSNVRFPQGVKVLFKSESRHKQFGSRRR
jgi:hypothetical protein